MNDTTTISVQVDSEVAEYYRSASDMDHRKVEFLVNSFLRDMMALAKGSKKRRRRVALVGRLTLSAAGLS